MAKVQITVEVEDFEKKALESVCIDPTDFVQNFVSVRCTQASEQIQQDLMLHCNENEIAMAVGVEAQINQAYELGVAKTVIQKNAELEEENQNLANLSEE